MKKISFITSLFLLATIFFGCTKSKSTQILVEEYFKGFNNSNFSTVEKVINDSIRILEGDYTVAGSIQEFKTNFDWDQTFNPQYKIVETININNDSAEIVISKTCDRINFLLDTAILCKIKLDFVDNKITKVNTVEYLKFDFVKWQQRRDSLVAWADIHHPELKGFANDMTVAGAQNYKKAIDYYINEK